QRLEGLDDAEALQRAGGPGDDLDATGPEAQRLQYLVAYLHLLDRIGRERDADRVDDPQPDKVAKSDAGFYRAGHDAPGPGDAEMDGRVGGLRQLLIGRRGEEDVGGLAGNLELVNVVVLQELDVIEPAFHHRVRAGFAVLVEQVLFKAAGIDADPDRTAVILRGPHDLAHPIGRA